MLKTFCFIFLICAAGTVWANTTYTTSTGAVFTQVQGPSGPKGSFGLTWKDPSGMIWSSYQGEYGNAAIRPDRNGTVMDSAATEACAKIGGKLPTVQNYETLVSYFDLGDLEGYQVLTDQGRKDFYTLFPDMGGRFFWSSTLGPYYPGYYHGPNPNPADRGDGFSSYYGVIHAWDAPGASRYDKNSVRCVAE